MERDAIRLECIKLAATRTSDHADALKRAEDYFGFVVKTDPKNEGVDDRKVVVIAGNTKTKT